MMKKLISLLLVFVLVVGLVACSSGTSGTDATGQKENNTSETTNMETSNTVVTTPTQDINRRIIQIPGREIYFSTDKDWTIDNDDFAIMLYENMDCMVAICYDRVSEFNGDYEKMIASLSKDFVSEASGKCQGYIRNSKLEIISSEKGSVSDYECTKFNGIIDNDGKWNCHAYGYAYVIEGVNLMVLGIVSAPDQDSEMIAKIDALTDQIATSIRTEK